MQSVRVLRQPAELPDKLYEGLPRYLTDAIRRCGAWRAEELRLHRGRIATVTCSGRNFSTGVSLREDEMNDILHRMCGGSLYAYNQTINQGFLTMDGGIRVGVCGSAAMENGKIIGVNSISGLIVRIPHRTEVSAEPVLGLLRPMPVTTAPPWDSIAPSWVMHSKVAQISWEWARLWMWLVPLARAAPMMSR